MTPPLVTVTWNDAASSATLIWDQDRDHRAIVMATVGWLVRRDASGVTVANERFHEDGQERYRGWTFVPHGMVVRVTAITSRRNHKGGR